MSKKYSRLNVWYYKIYRKMINVSITNNLLSKYEYFSNGYLEYLFGYLMYKKYNLLLLYWLNTNKNEKFEIFWDIVIYFQNSIQKKFFNIYYLFSLW